jgi:hypothetical protein
MSQRKVRLLARLDNMTLPLTISAIMFQIPTVSFADLKPEEQDRLRSFEDPEGELINGG